MDDELRYHYKYPHPSVTADCVVFGFDGVNLMILLVERGHEPYKGKWAFPGGFINIDESAESGALRELKEETGLSDVVINQFYAFTNPDRDPRERVISIAYYAVVRLQSVTGGDDAAKASWFKFEEIPSLAFDHQEILCRACETLYKKLLCEPLDFSFLPDGITMLEFRNFYSFVRNNFDYQKKPDSKQ